MLAGRGSESKDAQIACGVTNAQKKACGFHHTWLGHVRRRKNAPRKKLT